MKTVADAKYLFMSSLSDTNEIAPCSSSIGLEGQSTEEDIEVPDTYDWREEYP